MHAAAEVVRPRINPGVGTVAAVDEGNCTLSTSADHLETLAVHLGLIGHDFTATEPPELLEHLRALADRYVRATDTAAARKG